MTLLFALIASAFASIDPACQSVADQGAPSDYNETAQNDYLLNYFALATTFSPLHAPVPNKPGRGSIGLEMSVIPPLSCERRLVLSYSKTEDTNKAPVLPRPRVLFTFPKVGPVIPYAGLGYVPPVTVFGTRNVIVSGEAGLGMEKGNLQFGGRYHFTLMKTVAEIATPFVETDPAVLDFYSGSTFGVDLMGGYQAGKFTPYVAVGFTDVSTFFYIGDDDYIGNNYSPYAGLTASVGTQVHLKHIDLAAEFYTAPKNFDTKALEDLVASQGLPAEQAAFAPSHIYTGRLRASYVFY